MGKNVTQQFWRVLALVLALGVGSYVVFCRGANRTVDDRADSIAGPRTSESVSSKQEAIEDPRPPESCEGLALEIRRFDIFMTTSKSGPSPADLQRLDAMRARYEQHCPR
jgi:hypothetical protein